MKTVRELSQSLRDRDSLSGVQTLVEAVGTKRVLVEHHVSYGDQEIRIASTYGVVCVQGEGLRLCCMNREQVFLSGQIKSISMEREKP